MGISKHFQRFEYACRDQCGFDVVDKELNKVHEDVRKHFGKPVRIKSGCRCLKHNNQVGGAPESQHLLGKASDITVDDTPADEVATYLEDKYPNKYGIGRYTGRTHIDVRSHPARWDRRGLP